MKLAFSSDKVGEFTKIETERRGIYVRFLFYLITYTMKLSDVCSKPKTSPGIDEPVCMINVDAAAVETL